MSSGININQEGISGVNSSVKIDTSIVTKIKSILGIKLGMTKIFDADGDTIPVTVVSAGPCEIVNIRNKEKNGYSAIQIGYLNVDEKDINKPTAGYFKKLNVKPCKFLKEIKVDDIEGFTVGQEFDVSIFSEGDLVKVTGITKGKGFAGVVKRHNFSGGPRTHGQSDRQRAPGAIGSQRPQRVKKGTRMAGHMGNVVRTVRNLSVVKVIPEKNLIALKGSIPGPNNGLVTITKIGSKPVKQKLTVSSQPQKKKTTKGKPLKDTGKKK